MNLSEKQLILGGIFIVLLSGLVFNLSNITGHAVLDTEASLHVTPTTVNNGGDISIAVNPKEEGVSSSVGIFHNGKKVGDSGKLCEEYRCYKAVDVTYTIPDNFEQGIYTARTYDYSESRYIEANFRVE